MTIEANIQIYVYLVGHLNKLYFLVYNYFFMLQKTASKTYASEQLANYSVANYFLQFKCRIVEK